MGGQGNRNGVRAGRKAALLLGAMALAMPDLAGAQGPLGSPIGAPIPSRSAKPKTGPKPAPKPVQQAPEQPQPQAPLPVQRTPARSAGSLGDPFGAAIGPSQASTMFGDGQNSSGIEMSLWPEDIEVVNGVLQWRVNIIRFSPGVSSMYRTPVRPDGYITGVGKVAATFILNQDSTCTSVLSIAGTPMAQIRLACTNGPGLMFRVLKPPRQTRWIVLSAVFRETEGAPTVVREYLVDMRTKDVVQVTDFAAEGFTVGGCSNEAKVLWNSDSAQRLGLRVNQCLNTDLWPSDEGRLSGSLPPPEQASVRVRPAPDPQPQGFQNPPPASAEETARWISGYSDRFLGSEVRVETTALARVRTLPTSDGSTVLGSLPAGTTTAGRWVEGRDPTTRWLKLTDSKGYVWEGNLSEVAVYGPVRPEPMPQTYSELLTRIDGLQIRPGLKAVVKETVVKYGSIADFASISANVRYAELANAAYEDNPTVKGWDNISGLFPDLTSGAFGFRGYVFQQGKEVVVAYRGTDSKIDWITNLSLGSGQILQASKLYLAAKTYCQCDVTLTGHSLGGGLTQVVAANTGARGIAFDPAPFAAALSELPNQAFPNVISFRNSNDPLTLAMGRQTVGKLVTVKNTAQITTGQSVVLLSTFNHQMDMLFMAMQAVELTRKTLIDNGLVQR